MNTRIARTATLAGLSAVLLASCGGGDDSGAASLPAPAPAVSSSDIPQSATVDPNAAFNFVAQVAATRDDAADPLRIGGATLATSNTDEPRALR